MPVVPEKIQTEPTIPERISSRTTDQRSQFVLAKGRERERERKNRWERTYPEIRRNARSTTIVYDIPAGTVSWMEDR